MRSLLMIFAAIALANPPLVLAQQLRQREQAFMTAPPLIGETLPSVVVYSADGKPFDTASLRGHYTVLTFGCLTCPPSMWNIAGLEAVQRDYGPKGVKFYFIYKSLAHPELSGNYIQPFTIDERLKHAAQAKFQFGTAIPWLVDAMDNRLKRALGDRPNSQFIIDPDGKIVSKRAWSHPGLVRQELQAMVGATEQITRVEDLNLQLGQFVESAAPRGIYKRLIRSKMSALTIQPQMETNSLPFYAKLRAEADDELVQRGTGSLYLGFHIDPFHSAHWNNLIDPLSFMIESSDQVIIDKRDAVAEKVSAPSDTDPREFLVHVESWPADEPLQITVKYHACVGDACHAVQQSYVVHRERSVDGGGARGESAGLWEKSEFTQRLLAGDRNRDGAIAESEAVGIIAPHFSHIDKNNDGLLDQNELGALADWLNHHHQPAPPK